MEDPNAVSHGQVVAIVPIRPGNAAARLTIGGRTVLDRTIGSLRGVPEIGPIVLALEGVGAAACLDAIDGAKDPGLFVTRTTGTRWKAIAAALDLADGSELVVLHDPDRPFVSPAALTDLILRARGSDVTLSALPVRGTIKRVGDGRIARTVERDSLRVTQTPWVFRRNGLTGAVRRAIGETWPTDDDLPLATGAGPRILLVDGQESNVPIRSGADARFAELAAGR
jgi:2-C-methyl-D-erythritol 4-phosphate cytidylyltransferase